MPPGPRLVRALWGCCLLALLLVDSAAADVLPSIEWLLQEALAERPDLRAAHLLEQAEAAEVKAVEARWHPEVVLNIMGQAQRLDDLNAYGGGTSIGLVASVALLDGGERRAELNAARARLARQQARTETLRQDVQLEVRRAWRMVQAALEIQKLTHPAFEEAAEVYRLATLRYEVGRAIQLEVLDALTALRRARLNHLKAEYEAQTAMAELIWARGGTR